MNAVKLLPNARAARLSTRADSPKRRPIPSVHRGCHFGRKSQQFRVGTGRAVGPITHQTSVIGLCSRSTSMNKNISRLVVSWLLASAFLAGCESSESSSSSSSGSEASCSEVCAAIQNKCGQLPPDCEAACGNFNADAKNCLADAASGDAMNACGSTTGSGTGGDPTSGSGASTPGTGGSIPGSEDPCDACTGSQFCVTYSSVASELGCYDPPDSCNGSDMLCPCLSQAGTGPCSNGAANCTEGLSSSISCK